MTDFGKFHVADAAAGGDLAYTPGAFGAFCDPNQPMPCVPGQSAPSRPLMCLTELNGHPVTGGICTRECAIGPAACSDYGQANCAQAGANYCIPSCDLPSVSCRAGLTCCGVTGHPVTLGPGGCQPYCPP